MGGPSLDGPGAGGSGGSNYPAFNFDWTKARQDAITQLTPYYEQKLSDAKGDVELAKRYIEEDYQRGIRYSQENVTKGNQYADEDLAVQLKALGLDVTDETRNTLGALNQRGVLIGEMDPNQTSAKAPYSSYAQDWFLNPMNERQIARKQAVERAVTRQKEQLGMTEGRQQEGVGVTKTRGLEEQNIQYPRTQQALEEEKRQRAFNEVTPSIYQQEYTKYKVANSIPG